MNIMSLSEQEMLNLKGNVQVLPFVDVATPRNGAPFLYYFSADKLQKMYSIKEDFDDLDMILVDYGRINEAKSRAEIISQVVDADIASSVLSERTEMRRKMRLARTDDRSSNPGERSYKSWYGTKDVDYVRGDKRVYPKLKEALKFFDQFESELKINPETDVPRPKTLYTSRPNGIFTFARAAATLYALPCFVTEPEQRDCISASRVSKENNRYFLTDAPDVDVFVNGFEKRENGRDKFRSRTKSVYAVKPPKDTVSPYIHIYVNVGVPTDVKAEDYRYNSFAAATLAKLLNEQGFKVAITGIAMSLNEDNTNSSSGKKLGVKLSPNSINVSFYRIKDYTEALDYNSLLIFGGDPAFYRYDHFNNMANYVSAWDKLIDMGLGQPITSDARIDKYLDRYNVYTVQNETRVIVSKAFSEYRAKDAVRSKLAELKILYGSRS